MSTFHPYRRILRQLAVVGAAYAAAYLGARMGHRPVVAGLADLTSSVDLIASQVKADYWKIYDDVQQDLLLDEHSANDRS